MKVLMIITVDLAKNGISTCALNYCSQLVKHEIKVDLPRPRVYSDPAFLEIRRQIEEICDDTL